MVLNFFFFDNFFNNSKNQSKNDIKKYKVKLNYNMILIKFLNFLQFFDIYIKNNNSIIEK